MSVCLILSVLLTACGGTDSGNGYSYQGDDTIGSNDNKRGEVTEGYDYYKDENRKIAYTVAGLHYLSKDIKDVSFDELRTAVAENENIDGDIATCLNNIIDAIEKDYPSIDLSCFYYNIEKLDVCYATPDEMEWRCGSKTAKGLFKPENHTIFISTEITDEEIKYVIPHEITHMVNNLVISDGSKEIWREFCKAYNIGFMEEEAFNSMFNRELLGITYDDDPYQMPMNYMKIMMDVTGFTLDDYLDGGYIQYEKAIEQYGFSDDEVFRASNLMYDQKYNIRGNGDIDVEDSEFADLYRMYASLYFNNKLSGSSGHDEIVSTYMAFYNQLNVNIDYERMDMTPAVDTLFMVLEEKGVSESDYPNREELPVHQK